MPYAAPEEDLLQSAPSSKTDPQASNSPHSHKAQGSFSETASAQVLGQNAAEAQAKLQSPEALNPQNIPAAKSAVTSTTKEPQTAALRVQQPLAANHPYVQSIQRTEQLQPAQSLGADAALPLRKEADIYLSALLDVDYVSSLITYLIRQGLTVGRFDNQHSFKDTDVILLKAGESSPAAGHVHAVKDKRALWEFLKQEFKGQLGK